MTRPFVFCLTILIMSGAVSPQPHNQAEAKEPVDSRPRLTVTQYCEKFARTYAEHETTDYQEKSAQITKRSDIPMWIENVFQPSDSEFTAGYGCSFRVGAASQDVRELSVEIVLTKTLKFAKYTQWKDLQIIPIEYVVDRSNDRRGYGVFKYLDE